jgi:hypothetical protein
MAVVTDPNGVRVELIDLPPAPVTAGRLRGVNT